MLIRKELSGIVSFVQPNGTVIKQLESVVTMSANPQRAGFYVCDSLGREFFISLAQVVETQILPAAAVAFSGDLSILWALLTSSFFTELHSTSSGTNIESIGNWIWVRDLNSLPAPVVGVITLEAEKTYVIVGNVDLLGNRLVTSGDTTIMGGSSETSSLTSTGLSALLPLISSKWTIAMQHLSIKNVAIGVKIDGTINPPVALDWTGVNFSNVATSVDINTCSNFIFSKGALLNSNGINFTGTVDTIGIDNSLFSGTGAAANIFNIAAGTTITRRFRIIYSSIVAFGSTVGINVDVAATVPVEGYILDTVVFSGGGTYQTGVTYLDNKSLFINCRGIVNTFTILNYYMLNNATATVIGATNTPVKIAGTTTETALTQKFTHTDNKGVYNGALSIDLQITCVLSFTTANNNVVGVYIAKNGAVLPDSEMYATANAAGRAESIAVQTIVTALTTDYFEIWIENNTSVANITVEYMNVIIKTI